MLTQQGVAKLQGDFLAGRILSVGHFVGSHRGNQCEISRRKGIKLVLAKDIAAAGNAIAQLQLRMAVDFKGSSRADGYEIRLAADE